MTSTPSLPDPARAPDHPTRTAPRSLWAAMPLVLGCATLVVLVALALLSAAGELDVRLLMNPGAVVRYGLPAARALHDATAALTIGLLVLAASILPGQSDEPEALSYWQWRAARWAAWSSSLWFISAVVVVALTAGNSIGTGPQEPGFWTQALHYATSIDLGQYLAISTLLVLATLLTLTAARTVSRVVLALAFALVALLPVALVGHAAGTEEHANAVNSLIVHLVAVTVWVGGLAGLALLLPRLRGSLPIVVTRYSTAAAWCFAATAASGVVNASLRLTNPSDLVATPYGRLLLVKTAALALLGAAGWAQRRRVIPHVGGLHGRRAFARLALVEVVIMALTFGASVALSRMAPPVPQDPSAFDVRLSLLGFPYPPAVSFSTMISEVQPDWLFVALAVVLATLYLAGVFRLRRQGLTWPRARTSAWVSGCLVLLWATSGGAGVYASVHLSTHVLHATLLILVVPLLLTLGAPLPLALQVLPARPDGSGGPRELADTLSRSVLSARPGVAAVVLVALVAVYFGTGWLKWGLFEHAGTLAMQVLFLAAGTVFFHVVLGTGPDRNAVPASRALLAVTVVGVGLAALGVALHTLPGLLAQDWWFTMQYDDVRALRADQSRGALVAIAAAVVTTAATVALLLARRSGRLQRPRQDRRRLSTG